MSARILILDAGSPSSNNLIRSLKAGDPSLEVVGCGEDPFFLKKSTAERNYLLPLDSEKHLTALRRIIKAERIDLVIPTNDGDVLRMSELRNRLGCRTFLPRTSLIKRCNDKYGLSAFLHRRGVPVPRTFSIRELDDVERIFRRFKPGAKLWCRIRSGSGSAGAIPVSTPDQVRGWIAYWDGMRAVPPEMFTLSEYLPGRDFSVQCLWHEGELVLAKMAERITYLDNGGPSGTGSMPALAQTVFDRRVFDMCAKAIRALDPKASGIFFIDIKESEDGRPCITEINAGRFATMTNIHDLTGKHNMALMYVRLALGERVRLPKASDFVEGYYLVRSVDTEPALVWKDDLFEGISEIAEFR